MRSGRQENPAEEVVERVLTKMKDEDRIRGYLRNRTSDRLDSEGIDFLIILNTNLALPLQVKTCNKQNGGKGSKDYDRKLKEHLRKHPLVKFFICIQTNMLNSNPDRLYQIVERDLVNLISI